MENIILAAFEWHGGTSFIGCGDCSRRWFLSTSRFL